MKRRTLLSGVGFAALPVLGADKLPNRTIDESNVMPKQEKFGTTRVYFDGPTDHLKWMSAGSLRLKPGASPHSPHQHEEEEIMLVTEGIGDIVIDGRTTKVGPGAMMYCAAGKTHGIVNSGKEPLLFYYYKWRV